MKNLTLILLMLSYCMFGNSQETDEYLQDATIDQSFLIIQSTRSYNAALRKAQAACNELGLPLNLGGNYADKELGLTNATICGCGLKHGYIARGRGDAGNFISIEYSSAFQGFSKGFYIVVVSSGDREDVELLLPEVKEVYRDAYIKNSPIYVGCMH